MADSHPSGPLPQQTTHHIPSSPWIPIPDKRIICIEHPAIIRNLDKGIATIGGEDALKKVRPLRDRVSMLLPDNFQLAASNGNKPMHLRFRPNDPMQPPIESRSVPTNNLLLKITIPRRRKKRRTGDDETPGADAAPKTLREKLKASKGNYKVEAVGMIDKTVRFRGRFGSINLVCHCCLTVLQIWPTSSGTPRGQRSLQR